MYITQVSRELSYVIKLVLLIQKYILKDVVSKGACRKDLSGLPDRNCAFYATDSEVTSSLMALPYLSKNVNYCDDDAGIPIHKFLINWTNKQYEFLKLEKNLELFKILFRDIPAQPRYSNQAESLL